MMVNNHDAKVQKNTETAKKIYKYLIILFK